MLAAPLVSLVVLGATAAGAAASTACPGDERASTGLEAAAALVCDVNTVRARNGLAPLRWNWLLRLSAQDLATDMAASHFVGHISSDGRTLWDRVDATGYLTGAPAPLLLENVDWGSYVYSTPLATVSGWLESTEHRAHVLDPEVEEIGVGIASGAARSGGSDGLFYVADFASRGRDTSLLRTTVQPATKAGPRRCRKHARRAHHRRSCRH